MPRGIYKRTKEHKEKVRKALKGIKRSEKTKNKMRGKNNPMYGVHRFGEDSPGWKGGKRIGKYGYILIYKPNHPFAYKDKYIRKCILVMEKHLGRYLTKEEIVHHKGIKYPLDSIENRQDDRIENLQLFNGDSSHIKFHCEKRKRSQLGHFIP